MSLSNSSRPRGMCQVIPAQCKPRLGGATPEAEPCAALHGWTAGLQNNSLTAPGAARGTPESCRSPPDRAFRVLESPGTDTEPQEASASSAAFALKSPVNRRRVLIAYPPSIGGIVRPTTRWHAAAVRLLADAVCSHLILKDSSPPSTSLATSPFLG